jgi:hypothetical protein
MNSLKYKLLCVLGLCGMVLHVNAATVVAGYTFEDNAFVDQVVGSNGNFLNYNSATVRDVISASQLSADLTDHSAGTYVLSLSPNAYVDLAFVSAPVVNEQGNDLAFFFAGNATFSISLSGQTRSYTSTSTGYTITDRFGEYSLTIAQVDLSSFGVSPDSPLGTFRVMLNNNAPALSLVGSFNTGVSEVPLPASLFLMFSGLAALGLIRRRK